MHLKELVENNKDFRKVHVHFEDRNDFVSVTYLNTDSSLERGLYVPDCDSAEAMAAYKDGFPDAYERMKRTVEEIAEFNDITFSLFALLHELGHWVQYSDFIEQGHNDTEFKLLYERERALLYARREVEYLQCKSNEDIMMLNRKYDRLYAMLPTEKNADQYAKEALLNAFNSITNSGGV